MGACDPSHWSGPRGPSRPTQRQGQARSTPGLLCGDHRAGWRHHDAGAGSRLARRDRRARAPERDRKIPSQARLYTQKKSLVAAERLPLLRHWSERQWQRTKVRRQREGWFKHRLPAVSAQPERVVFIDETSVKTNLTRLRGWAPRGDRLIMDAPFGSWGTQTFIAGLRAQRGDSVPGHWTLSRRHNDEDIGADGRARQPRRIQIDARPSP
ncbi:MAG: hypothetical protein GKR99_06075 [Rhodobacteraceae bacterium]|nr:hypothetical protein [Paracoccaceae bacterium]